LPRRSTRSPAGSRTCYWELPRKPPRSPRTGRREHRRSGRWSVAVGQQLAVDLADGVEFLACVGELFERLKTVAYVALAAAGLDTGQDSVPYIASWAGDDTLDQLEQTAELIDGLARRIEQAIAPGAAGERELELREVA
jgi:hypothetical protein